MSALLAWATRPRTNWSWGEWISTTEPAYADKQRQHDKCGCRIWAEPLSQGAVGDTAPPRQTDRRSNHADGNAVIGPVDELLGDTPDLVWQRAANASCRFGYKP
jgi:hypothetical protein